VEGSHDNDLPGRQPGPEAVLGAGLQPSTIERITAALARPDSNLRQRL
jgi:hypothetical protein